MKAYPNSARIAGASGSNFYWSFFFLPRVKRNGILAIYAFSRLVDDAVDEAESAEKAREEIALWRRRLDLCYGQNGGPREGDEAFHPVLPEVADAVQRFEMPRQYRDLGDYLLLDGHNRREAALRTQTEFPIIVINTPKDLRYVPQYNDPQCTRMGQDFFDMLKRDYIEDAIRELKTKRAPQRNLL